MTYVFDTNTLSSIFGYYYRDRFPTFWDRFDETAKGKRISSVREVGHELRERYEEKTKQLVKQHPDFFTDPTPDELSFITAIYSVSHFQQNLDRKKLVKGGYFADPFIIAKAHASGGLVVTEESRKDNGSRIPNICEHFSIEWTNLEGFLTKEDWKF